MSISHLKKQYLNGRSVFGRNTLDHYCMNATENQMIYRTDVLSSGWNYHKGKGYALSINLTPYTNISSTVKKCKDIVDNSSHIYWFCIFHIRKSNNGKIPNQSNIILV